MIALHQVLSELDCNDRVPKPRRCHPERAQRVDGYASCKFAAKVGFAILLIALASPALLLAQFQQPTDEELKMTADPKAPGAAAVYLDYENVTNDPQHHISIYARIKVLQEKGKELATVHLPYVQQHGLTRVEDIKARTIHSDGTVIPMVVKPEELLFAQGTTNEGYKFQLDRKVFNLPSVEVGSILEYRYVVSYNERAISAPFWEIQGPYFFHKAHYSFTPYKKFLWGYQYQTGAYMMDKHFDKLDTLIWTGFLPVGSEVKSDTAGSLSVDLTDIPPAPKEDWMPPVESTRFRVLFYFKSAKPPLNFGSLRQGTGLKMWIISPNPLCLSRMPLPL